MSDQFKTTDMNLAAALVAVGFHRPLIDDEMDEAKATFIFSQDGMEQPISEYVEEYQNNRLMVDARKIMHGFWSLKNSVYKLRRENGKMKGHKE